MKNKIFEWLLGIGLIIGIVSISYSLGYSILQDYRNNGLVSVSIVLSFIIGIPMLYVFSKVVNKTLYKSKNTTKYDKAMERMYNQETVDLDNAINTLKNTSSKEELEEKYSKFSR